VADPRTSPIEQLAERAAFPGHGYFSDRDGDKHLVLPIERALASVRVLTPPVEHLGGRRIARGLGFRDGLMRLLFILDEVALREEAILAAPRVAERADWFEALAAQEEIGFFVESFVIYFRALADRFAATFAHLIAEQPGSSWEDYGALLKRAESSRPPPLKMPDGGDAIYQAVVAHRDWFDLLRHPKGGHKGLRDAILHMPVRTQLQMHKDDANDERYSGIGIYLTPRRRGEPPVELLSASTQIVAGFCAMCDAFPVELWTPSEFTNPDLIIHYGSEPGSAMKFFPSVAPLEHRTEGGHVRPSRR
jgi:hypothetical protein